MEHGDGGCGLGKGATKGLHGERLGVSNACSLAQGVPARGWVECLANKPGRIAGYEEET
jgi:hypothetical protein